MFPIECGDPGADCAGDGGVAAGAGRAGRAGQGQAEAKPKAKPPPLAKPKAKPQPQPQAPPPPLPPRHPLAARKSAAVAPEDPEVEEMRGGLTGLSASLATSKGAKAKLEAKVSQWETKLAEVRAMGDEEWVRMAEDTLRKAKAKVAEKEEAIEALDRSVRRTELVLARTVKKVNEEEEDEVVEVEVEAEEMEEGMVKEEVGAKVVVETPRGGGGSGSWGLWGRGVWGPSTTCHGTWLSWLAPTPQTWTPPSLSPRRVRSGLSGFCCSGCTSGCWGRGGGYGWTRGGWSTWTGLCA